MSIKLLLINRIEDSESNQPFRAERHASAQINLDYKTYLKILPRMETSLVKGHFLSTQEPSMAVWGVLKPNHNKSFIQYSNYPRQSEAQNKRAFVPRSVHGDGERLTESNFFVKSNTAGCFFGQDFLGGKEDALLLLEGLFSLKISHLWQLIVGK